MLIQDVCMLLMQEGRSDINYCDTRINNDYSLAAASLEKKSYNQ